eukprot:g1209.t1
MDGDEFRARRTSKRVASSSLNSGKKETRLKRQKRMSSCAVDFAKLEMSSLLKYKHVFGLQIRPGAPKRDVIQAVQKHFMHHPRIQDTEVISAFLYANKKYLQASAALQP